MMEIIRFVALVMVIIVLVIIIVFKPDPVVDPV